MEIYGTKLIDMPDLLKLMYRYFLNTGIILIIIRFLYYSSTKRKNYFFTFFLIGTVVFFICYLLGNVKLELGFALGLFAIFGILRYRTNPMPIRETTYLFLVIGISVINALVNRKVSYAEQFFTNFAIIFSVFILEKTGFLKHESAKRINYENVEMIRSHNLDKLKVDLETRMGMKINRIEVGNVDYLKDEAKILVYYFDQGNKVNEFESMGRPADSGDDED